MSGYLLNFIVYTTAMIGVIFLAVFVYKKMNFTSGSSSKFLNIEDTMALAPRKNLYVVRAGNERFLIASDAERTALISKLEEGQNILSFKESSSSVEDLPVIVDFQKKKSTGKTAQEVLKNIVNGGISQ